MTPIATLLKRLAGTRFEMILTVKTDNPIAELGLLRPGGELVDQYSWEAGRELARDLLKQIQTLLHKNKTNFEALSAIIVFAGPGSFTGLRIGITVANTIAYVNKMPIVGVKGKNWQELGLKRLVEQQNDRIVLPHYGATPNITLPKGY